MKKKILTTLCAALVALGSSQAYALTQDADGVYQIADGQDLVDFAKLVNSGSGAFKGSAVLTADIDMSGLTFTPIGVSGKRFAGKFDGGGHTVSNLTVTGVTAAGLFNMTSGGAVIRNLTIDSSCSFSTASASGVTGETGRTAALVVYFGHADNGATLTIENCHNYADVTSYSKSTAAGIIAEVWSSSGSTSKVVTIRNCTNSGTINGGFAAGGIVGHVVAQSSIKSSVTLTVEGCTNYGAVSSTNGAGGIVGNCLYNGDCGSETKDYSASVAKSIALNGCRNEGAVTTTANGAGGMMGISPQGRTLSMTDCSNSGTVNVKENGGGMLGNSYGGTTTATKGTATFTRCTNTGNITGSNTRIGGMVGLNGIVGTGSSGAYLTFESCSNSGTIKGTGSVAGIMGICYATGTLTMTDCYNTGTITCSGDFAGGLTGKSEDNSRLTSCYNIGNVSGTKENVGGLIGHMYNTCTITDCHNEGKVTYTGTSTGDTRVGGLVGWYQHRSGCTMTINRSYNAGAVSNAKGAMTGGLIGVSGATTTTTISKSWNTGAISGATKVGGLLGQSSNVVTLTDCYNTGDITATSSYAGALSGNFGSVANALVANSWNTGTITNPSPSGTNTLYGAVPTKAGTGNNYDLASASTAQPAPTGYDAAWLTNGQFTKYVNDQAGERIYRQTIGTDAHPVLDGTHGIVEYISAAGYATFYAEDEAVSIPTGVTAYLGKINTGGATATLALTDAGRSIPAACPVVIAGSEGYYSMVPTTCDDVVDNDLQGSSSAVALDTSAYRYYILWRSASKPVGFYEVSSGEIPANRAYLRTDAGVSVKAFVLDTETGIAAPPSGTRADGAVYDLSGRRVQRPQRGIYIENGRKVVRL